MLSRKKKIEYLSNYYNSVAGKDRATTCPFKKDSVTIKTLGNMKEGPDKDEIVLLCSISCADLCGSFPELGDCKRGCPCETLGDDIAMLQLGSLVRKVKK